MRWGRLLAAGLVIASGAGCAADPWTLSGRPGGDALAVRRMQMPDGSEVRGEPEQSPLDMPLASPDDPSNGQVAVRVLATVNHVPILDQEVKEIALEALLQARSETDREMILKNALEQLIDREVILQDALARLNRGPGQKYLDKLKEAANKEFDRKVRQMKAATGAKSDEEFKGYLRQYGRSLDAMRRQWERTFISGQYMRSRIEPAVDRIGHEQVVEYYRKHPEEFRTEDRVEWQDIFIDVRNHPDRESARRFAQELIQQAQAGADFGKLAIQYDNGDSAYRNGDGYGNQRGEIRPPEAEPILFQLREGEIGPIIEIANGFHVIRLVKRQYAGIQPLDEKTQTRIRAKLREEVTEREYKRVLAELKRNATIKYASDVP